LAKRAEVAISRPVSENTLNAALRRLGYSKGEMTAHGFKGMASTRLNEMGCWNPDAIELASFTFFVCSAGTATILIGRYVVRPDGTEKWGKVIRAANIKAD
jgi:hypothetical protein